MPAIILSSLSSQKMPGEVEFKLSIENCFHEFLILWIVSTKWELTIFMILHRLIRIEYRIFMLTIHKEICVWKRGEKSYQEEWKDFLKSIYQEILINYILLFSFSSWRSFDLFILSTWCKIINSEQGYILDLRFLINKLSLQIH